MEPSSLAQLKSVQFYNRIPTGRPSGSISDGNRPEQEPLIYPKATPHEIMQGVFNVSNRMELYENADYQAIIEHLKLYQRGGDSRSWDDYRRKVRPDLLEKFAKILAGCYENGFTGPYVYEDKMQWRQWVRQEAVLEDELVHIECTFGQHLGETFYYDAKVAKELISGRRAKLVEDDPPF